MIPIYKEIIGKMFVIDILAYVGDDIEIVVWMIMMKSIQKCNLNLREQVWCLLCELFFIVGEINFESELYLKIKVV